MMHKTPLAWLQLTREKTRLAVALAGIAFADILMFMQLGFKDALFEGNVQFHKSLQGDIVLIHPQSKSMSFLRSFSQRRLYQALAVKSVESVHPIYLDFAGWRNQETRQLSEILFIGVNPEASVFNLPGVEQNLDKVQMPDVVLFDRGSGEEFGPIAADFDQGKLSSQKCKIAELE